jgi:hypothetical protein
MFVYGTGPLTPRVLLPTSVLSPTTWNLQQIWLLDIIQKLIRLKHTYRIYHTIMLVITRCKGGDENDVMEGNDDNDFLYGFDGVPNNHNLDSGEGPDICQSEPFPEVNCERS